VLTAIGVVVASIVLAVVIEAVSTAFVVAVAVVFPAAVFKPFVAQPRFLPSALVPAHDFVAIHVSGDHLWQRDHLNKRYAV
jgi:hypothetical protein